MHDTTLQLRAVKNNVLLNKNNNNNNNNSSFTDRRETSDGYGGNSDQRAAMVTVAYSDHDVHLSALQLNYKTADRFPFAERSYYSSHIISSDLISIDLI